MFHSHLLLFKAIVTVNLTSLLVLTTLFISVSSSLPQTAYVKMVDVWLIFAQVVPWVEVLLHTLVDWMRTDKEEEEGRSTIMARPSPLGVGLVLDV